MARKGSKGPQFVEYFWPIIRALKELGGSARPEEVGDKIAIDLQVPQKVLTEVSETGNLRFYNRVAWARFYLSKAGLLDSSKRGVWTLTEQGRSIDTSSHEGALKLFDELRNRFKKVSVSDQISPEDEGEAPSGDADSPDSSDYRSEILNALRVLPPAGFERFCQRLLRESGFQEVTVTGRPSDGGIDGIGILQVNPLVSFKVLFQCKRYLRTVSPTQVRDFRGAMQGRADKGIIMTTGSFTSEAKREALRDGVPPIELVDGEKIVDMLKELELGLLPMTTYRLDQEFFREFAD